MAGGERADPDVVDLCPVPAGAGRRHGLSVGMAVYRLYRLFDDRSVAPCLDGDPRHRRGGADAHLRLVADLCDGRAVFDPRHIAGRRKCLSGRSGGGDARGGLGHDRADPCRDIAGDQDHAGKAAFRGRSGSTGPARLCRALFAGSGRPAGAGRLADRAIDRRSQRRGAVLLHGAAGL